MRGLQEFSNMDCSSHKQFFCNLNLVPEAMAVEKEFKRYELWEQSSLFFFFDVTKSIGKTTKS